MTEPVNPRVLRMWEGRELARARRKVEFLRAYLETKLNRDAGLAAARVTNWTLQTWLRSDPAFRRRFDQVEAAVATEVLSEQTRLGLTSPDEKVRVRANDSVLQYVIRHRALLAGLPQPGDVEESRLAEHVAYWQSQFANLVPAGPTNGGAEPPPHRANGSGSGEASAA
jgi:hypothetical protein